MAKNTSKKIKELKGIKPEKIDEQELAQMQASVKTVDNITNQIGSMEVRKYSLAKALEQIHERLETLRITLQKKYGTDNINIQDGTITYSTQPEPQLENGEVNKED